MSLYDHFTEKEREILLARRAQRLTDEKRAVRAGETGTALAVRVRRENYALPVEKLTYAHVGVPVIPVPCAPPQIAGVANIRGHIVPVLDLCVLLHVPGPAETATTMLVVATDGEMLVAFQVEQIGDIITFALGEVAPMPQPIESESTPNYLQGILPGGITLLDVVAILQDPALIVAETVG